MRTAYLSLFIAATIWGITIPAMKYALEYVPVFVLAFIRFAGASLILYPFVRKNLAIKPQHFLLIIAAGLTGISFHIAFFFYGLTYTSASNAGVLFASAPLFTLLFAALFLREKISKRMIFGALVGFIGIIVVTIPHAHGTVTFAPIGDILILASTFSLVLYQIFSKKLFAHYTASVVTFYSFLIGSITFAPMALQYFVQKPTFFTELPTNSLLAIGFGIVFSSFIAYSLWQKGLTKVSASRVGFFLYLDPIIATVTAVILLNETITPLFVIGSFLIFGGILIAHSHIKQTRKKSKKRRH